MDGRRSTVKYCLLVLVLSDLCFEYVTSGRWEPATSWDSGEPEILMPTDTEREAAGKKGEEGADKKGEAEAAEKEGGSGGESGTRWAVLVAGSSGYSNYRHQADVCHAYQILNKGGIKDENIVVFMYDDIASHELNPRRGTIINHPQGQDVYAGVPKDYTGKDVTAENLYAVLLGDKSAVKGGSGKVVNSTAEDRIFLYYSDHGGPGVLGMPNMPFLYAGDFINVLKKKHAAKSYKEMVVYVESCESGSMFEGTMPEDLNIYVTTASNAEESSFGTYCPGMDPSPPPEYITCLGDLYSVAWMEDSETHNLKKESVKQQYEQVKLRTSNYNTYNGGSHVMQYGTKNITSEKLYFYQGFDPESVNFPSNKIINAPLGVVNQRDADLHFLWHMFKKFEGEMNKRKEILGMITNVMKHRIHLDVSIEMIGTLLFGPERASSVLSEVRQPGLPLVDNWQSLKSMVRLFESQCGSLTQYGMKHMRAFANICNNGVSEASMQDACLTACYGREVSHWHPSNGGYRA